MSTESTQRAASTDLKDFVERLLWSGDEGLLRILAAADSAYAARLRAEPVSYRAQVIDLFRSLKPSACEAGAEVRKLSSLLGFAAVVDATAVHAVLPLNSPELALSDNQLGLLFCRVAAQFGGIA
ncbi:hypothetical protein ABH944_008554 [Caballeronia udeis]|uniref:Uncharacterized protein n=1 Tax=Caballeronia udeis TaxID=1232866 RepID=A0ABW8MXN5_9BURK